MGLHRFKPVPSGRMGVLWTLATIRDAAVIEFGCMGHMLYAGTSLKRIGIQDACRLYSTHLNESDISMGDTSRLEKVIETVIKEINPRVIFLTPSAVPEVIGIDLHGFCRQVQARFPDNRLIVLGSGGFDKQLHDGVRETLTTLVKELTGSAGLTPNRTYNLIGSCADLFRFQEDKEELVRLLRETFQMEPLCILSSDTEIAGIEQMGSAHINLVIRREGKEAARELYKRFGTPYVCGRPYGVKGTTAWLEEIAEVIGYEGSREFIRKEEQFVWSRYRTVSPNFQRLLRSEPENLALSLGGHIDVVKGILEFGCTELSFPQARCWCDSPAMEEEGIPYLKEEEWIEIIEGHDKGLLMCSAEALEWGGKKTELQISNPDLKWRLYPFEPPFVGYRGALNLINLWINSCEA